MTATYLGGTAARSPSRQSSTAIDDSCYGGDGNDWLQGGNGNDLLIGGPGNDHMGGCYGRDFLLSRSDAGEPTIARSPGGPRVTEGIVIAGSRDEMFGGQNADIFRFELLTNLRADVIARNPNPDGTIKWQAVTRENGALHDHWVESIGDDVIRDSAGPSATPSRSSAMTCRSPASSTTTSSAAGRSKALSSCGPRVLAVPMTATHCHQHGVRRFGHRGGCAAARRSGDRGVQPSGARFAAG